MSQNSDNPLVRFAAFWWGLGVFCLFGVLLIGLRFYFGNNEDSNPLEEAAATKRYEIRAEIEKAQAANFAYKSVEEGKTVQVPPHDVYTLVGQQLLAAKPAAVVKPEQVVPNSPTAKKLADGPSADYAAVDQLTPAADAPIDPAVMEAGKAHFAGAGACFGCHGLDGAGTPIAPPLANSDWVTGPVSNLVRIQLRGLGGPLTVSGKVYNMPVPMNALPQQSNEEIAAVLTFVRNSFGNKASAVLPKQVEMLRSEVTKPVLTEADLIKPTKP